MRKKNKAQDTSSDESFSESEDSDDSTYSVTKRASPKRKRGRPAAAKNTKKQRLQDGSDNDINQPSTSQNGNGNNSASVESESDSGSETPDSDYDHVIDRSLMKKKTQKRGKGKSSKAPPSKSRRKQNHPLRYDDPPPVSGTQKGISNSSAISETQKRNSNSSIKKNGKIPMTNGVFDPKCVDALAQKCVYFLLIEDQKKYAIRRKAIVTHVFKDEAYSPKLYLAVMKKANSILKKTFGMELMELENQRDSYLIINILSRELGIHDYVELSRLKQQQHGLILYLVTVIYMNDNIITEEELTKSLKPLGIDLTSKRLHPVFGDVKKYITTELVKQMYLNYECVSKDPPKYDFTWGLRAKQEFGKMDLLQFACQIMNDTSPEDWKIQYKDAEKSSKPNTA